MAQLGIEEATRGGAVAEPGVGDTFVLRRDGDGSIQVHCAECDHHYGPAERDPKLAAVVSERPLSELNTLNEEGLVDRRLIARHYFCPSCGLQFAVNVQRQDDPIMLEWSIEGQSLPAVP